jgi:hypothetical protein
MSKPAVVDADRTAVSDDLRQLDVACAGNIRFGLRRSTRAGRQVRMNLLMARDVLPPDPYDPAEIAGLSEHLLRLYSWRFTIEETQWYPVTHQNTLLPWNPSFQKSETG